ncbi:MAG: hypothetical protein GY847_18110 [Proteobacteria bacterium]|nr:hypothetical protein [Pseudomonadota bacterium]
MDSFVYSRQTPEKEFQSFLISESYKNHRQITPINEKCPDQKLTYVTDEIPIPSSPKKIVCDLLAVRKVKNGYIPVLIELKSAREKKRLVEQVESYSKLIDLHSDLYAELYSALLNKPVRFVQPCEKWIVWPMTKKEKDPQEDDLAKKGIRVVGYKKQDNGFTFSIGKALAHRL